MHCMAESTLFLSSLAHASFVNAGDMETKWPRIFVGLSVGYAIIQKWNSSFVVHFLSIKHYGNTLVRSEHKV